jgi:hypothetical protein
MISSSEKSMDALIPVLNTRNFLEQFDVFKGSILAKSGKEFKSFTTGLPYEWEQYKKPYFPDLGLDLLIKLGEAPEQAYLTQLTGQGLTIVEIPTDGSRRDAAARTVEAIRGGADVIYQPTFLDGQWDERTIA